MSDQPNVTNRMLCWNPGTDEVRLVAWPDYSGASGAYAMTGLACYGKVQDMSFEQRKSYVFTEGMALIVRDGCCPQAVHRALCGLAEYRDGCPEDMPTIGAEVIPLIR